MKILLSELYDIFPESEILNKKEGFFTQISTDSRMIARGELFIPIKGDVFDGHDYIVSAIEKGAIAALSEKSSREKVSQSNGTLILVDDISEALKQLTNYIRKKTDLRIVGICGTTGKTTTRGLVAGMLSESFKVLNAPGNINTLWGNLRVLMDYDDHDIFVAEIAMDRLGEITWQCESIEPDIAVLVSIGQTHAEFVGGVEGVYKAEKEIADYMQKVGRLMIFNNDNELVQKVIAQYTGEFQTTGHSDVNNYSYNNVDVRSDGTFLDITYKGKTIPVRLSIFGEDYAQNATLAFAIGKFFYMPDDAIQRGLKRYKGTSGRFEVIKVSKYVTLINDAGNANLQSMELSLKTFKTLWGNGQNAHVFLGDMRELGEVTQEQHVALAELVKNHKFENVYYLGNNFNYFNIGQRLDSYQEAAEIVKEIIKHAEEQKLDTAILLKSSKSIGLEKIPELI
jgi:UDP-N-acetylmuramoyl-tripeptide--D-alanyl-D-alanine ligase